MYVIGCINAPLPATERGTAASHFRPMSIVVKRSPISVNAEHLLYLSQLVLTKRHNRLDDKLFETLAILKVTMYYRR